MHNCGLGEPAKELMSILDPGYAPWAFDQDGENKLWSMATELSGVVAVAA